MEKVLFVDDEASILSSIERLFVDSDIALSFAGNADQALEIIAQEEIAVVVSDNLMPGKRGLDFLADLKYVSPYAVKILMTAYADLPTALAAINRGEVYRFVVKPWDNDEFVETVKQSLQRYRTIKALREEDETILQSLAQTIELKDPYTKGHCGRVAAYALMLAEALHLPQRTVKDIRFGSWLHDCGKIGVPDAILNFGGPVNASDFETLKKHPDWGAEVVQQAHLSPTILNIVLSHHERFDGDGYPHGLAGEQIPLEARIVAAADVFDALTTDRPYRRAYPMRKAVEIFSSMAGSALDPQLVTIFLGVLRTNGVIPDSLAAEDGQHG